MNHRRRQTDPAEIAGTIILLVAAAALLYYIFTAYGTALR